MRHARVAKVRHRLQATCPRTDSLLPAHAHVADRAPSRTPRRSSTARMRLGRAEKREWREHTAHVPTLLGPELSQDGGGRRSRRRRRSRATYGGRKAGSIKRRSSGASEVAAAAVAAAVDAAAAEQPQPRPQPPQLPQHWQHWQQRQHGCSSFGADVLCCRRRHRSSGVSFSCTPRPSPSRTASKQTSGMAIIDNPAAQLLDYWGHQPGGHQPGCSSPPAGLRGTRSPQRRPHHSNSRRSANTPSTTPSARSLFSPFPLETTGWHGASTASV